MLRVPERRKHDNKIYSAEGEEEGGKYKVKDKNKKEDR
jgi:hypothetical protein